MWDGRYEEEEGCLINPKSMPKARLLADFLRARGQDISLIARRAGEPREEIEQCAWLALDELEKEAGHTLDLAEPEEQVRLLRRIRRLVARLRDRQPRPLSLDQPIGNDDSSDATLVDFVKAEPNADPIELIIYNEERAERRAGILEFCRRSFSQLSSYLLVLLRLDSEEREAAAEIGITKATLKQRLRRLSELCRIQPSLFDGIVEIKPEFVLRPALSRFRRPPSLPDAPIQLALSFPNSL
jgi:hypothetical protein